MTVFEQTSSNFSSFFEFLTLKPYEKGVVQCVSLAEKWGNGFVRTMEIQEGLPILLLDIEMQEPLLWSIHAPGTVPFFILQFTETDFTNNIASENNAHWFSLHQNNVLLTSSIMNPKFLFPAKARHRSIKLIFNKAQLLPYLDNNTVNKVISSYFLELLKNKNAEPIDADYRKWMNELMNETGTHPLYIQFIQNRIWLLLERFIRRTLNKNEGAEQFLKFTEDEVGRLMRVEAMLVKDFSTTAPTIATLARYAAMSPTKLKTDFKLLYGLPIYEYYQKNRMQYAKSLLLEKKYSIKEVGRKVGYTNLGHFAASFKREFGILPRQLFPSTSL